MPRGLHAIRKCSNHVVFPAKVFPPSCIAKVVLLLPLSFNVSFVDQVLLEGFMDALRCASEDKFLIPPCSDGQSLGYRTKRTAQNRRPKGRIRSTALA